MRNIHDPNEYNAYKNTSNSSNGGGSSRCPSGSGWIVIIIVILALISFISDGASGEAISMLLGLGIIPYKIFK